MSSYSRNYELRQLQNITSLMASFLGHSEGLFGMELAFINTRHRQWTDGSDYFYLPTKKKKLEDFTEQDCIDTLKQIHKWLEK